MEAGSIPGSHSERDDAGGLTAGRPADDIIQVRDEYYIRATSSLTDDRTLVLKQGNAFAIFDRYGDVQPIGLGQQGLFRDGTRYLSRLELRIEGARPLLLGSTVTRDNALAVADLTNPDLVRGDEFAARRDTIHIRRSAFLWDETLFLRLDVRNYNPRAIRTSLTLQLDVDFADIFEVRGARRPRRGVRYPAEIDTAGRAVRFRYDGLDRVARCSTVRFGAPPSELAPGFARFDVALGAGEKTAILLDLIGDAEAASANAGGSDGSSRTIVALRAQPGEAAEVEREHAAAQARRAVPPTAVDRLSIETSNEPFNAWLARSDADLSMMLTDVPTGVYPAAGVPWFCAPFGRDGIITALQVMWTRPEIGRDVLRFLAATQASALDPSVDAEPGKIVHEMRSGEMAALREIPFGRYYGSIDATPLFVILARAYSDLTGDLELVREIWPSLLGAIEWLERYGDRDGDSFVEYARQSEHGLRQQGWKDSEDSVFHADGSAAEGPIALCEVQAYAFGARSAAAALASAMGETDLASQQRAAAEHLRGRFEEAFWCEDLATYALALDGDKRACRVSTSNAGQCLLTGIVDPARARAVCETLMRPECFSGWGIRTVASTERRYNPISYHNGSIWPHDNSLIAAGMARYGFTAAAERLLAGLYDANQFFDLRRVPELFCGFARSGGEGPTPYPLACAPQSWAAGAVYLLLKSCLGMEIDGRAKRLGFSRTRLPAFLDRVLLRGLRVGSSRIDLELRRVAEDVGIHVTRREGPVEVVAVK